MEQFYLNQWKDTGKIISDTGFPSLSIHFLCCLSRAPLPEMQVRCCHLLQAGSGLNCLSLPWAEVKTVAQKGNMRWAASHSCPSAGFSRHVPQTWRGRCGQKQVHRVQWYPGTSGSTQHRTKDQPKYRMRRQKESQRMGVNHCFIIDVSYNFS